MSGFAFTTMPKCLWWCDKMVSHIATAVASTLILSCSMPPVNLNLRFRAAVNGIFFCTKTNRLASLVWWHGKEIAPLPTKVRRGGLVCYRNGYVDAGYWEWKGGKLTFNGKEIKAADVLWAVSGGGLWLKDGRALRLQEVKRRETLNDRILTCRDFSFILVWKDRRKVTLGVSKSGATPERLARFYSGSFYAMLRLDGGRETYYFRNRRKPKWVNNAIGVP
jgi:hypothetical protein